MPRASQTQFTPIPHSVSLSGPYSTHTGNRVRLIQLVLVGVALHLYALNIPRLYPQPLHDSRMSGVEKLWEWRGRHEHAMRDTLGIRPLIFKRLLHEIRTFSHLPGSRWISAEEQLAIFLYIARDGLNVRKTADTFNRSYETVHRSFHAVLNAFTEPQFYKRWIHLPPAHAPLPLQFSGNRHFAPFFHQCIGAIDGTLIQACPPLVSREPFCTRKGFLAINVLAACTFDLRFCYVLSGWEGSANDFRLYKDAVDHDLRIPVGKYFLGDAGFMSCAGTMVPYRGVRYHLKEWGRAKQRPKNHKELFNLRHATARNVIERIFGVIKKKWKLVGRSDQYLPDIQSRVILALCVLYNCVKTWDLTDPELDIHALLPSDSRIRQGLDAVYDEQDNEDIDDLEESCMEGGYGEGDKQKAEERREILAQSMWEDYKAQRELRRTR